MTIQGKTIIADEGKVLVRKDNPEPYLMIQDIQLGVNDSAENWEEVDAPEDLPAETNEQE